MEVQEVVLAASSLLYIVLRKWLFQEAVLGQPLDTNTIPLPSTSSLRENKTKHSNIWHIWQVQHIKYICIANLAHQAQLAHRVIQQNKPFNLPFQQIVTATENKDHTMPCSFFGNSWFYSMYHIGPSKGHSEKENFPKYLRFVSHIIWSLWFC